MLVSDGSIATMDQRPTVGDSVGRHVCSLRQTGVVILTWTGLICGDALLHFNVLLLPWPVRSLTAFKTCSKKMETDADQWCKHLLTVTRLARISTNKPRYDKKNKKTFSPTRVSCYLQIELCTGTMWISNNVWSKAKQIASDSASGNHYCSTAFAKPFKKEVPHHSWQKTFLCTVCVADVFGKWKKKRNSEREWRESAYCAALIRTKPMFHQRQVFLIYFISLLAMQPVNATRFMNQHARILSIH